MIPANLSPLANHLWQSTLFPAAAWLLALALRKNGAAVRYGIWLAASVKFLVPFSLLVGIGSQFGWRAAPAVGPVPISHVVEQISQPFALQAEAVPVAAATASVECCTRRSIDRLALRLCDQPGRLVPLVAAFPCGLTYRDNARFGSAGSGDDIAW